MRTGRPTKPLNLTAATGLPLSAVHRIRRAFPLQPHHSETLKLSRDPRFSEQVRDIVGLYMSSFVTHIMGPRDVDCVLLMKPHGRGDRTALRELRTGLPFLDLAVVRTRAFDEHVHSVFAADRTGVAKGFAASLGVTRVLRFFRPSRRSSPFVQNASMPQSARSAREWAPSWASRLPAS